MPKSRLDKLLVDRELAADLKEAAALAMAGKVFSGSHRLEKPGELLDEDTALSIRAPEHPYVSRGGLKLQAALDHSKLDVGGLACLDLGSSTGGFTDCLLRRGAAKVFAVDSGTNQLDWRLRNDPRVICMEQTNARELKPEALGGPVDFACADLSFIGLAKIFPAMAACLKPGAPWVALVKPQFEAAREEVPEGGVVTDASLHEAICARVRRAAEDFGLGPKELIPSPIRGREGNTEFLLLGRRV